MKLSEYAADLLEMARLYGDFDVVEEHPQAPDFIRRAVRAPRLRRIAVVEANYLAGQEVHCPKSAPLEQARKHRAKLTEELVFVV